MALAIYKPGQGYWTRTLTAIGVAALVLAGVAWLWGRFQSWFGGDNVFYYSGIMAVSMIVGFGLLTWWIVGIKQNIVDFMIATEAEMKKVNWPTRKEVLGSTWVVIAGTFMIAALLWVVNIVFAFIFQYLGILQGG